MVSHSFYADRHRGGGVEFMDDLFLRLGLKLLAFSLLFVGLSKAAHLIRGRPKPPGDKGGHKPDPWEPEPEPPKAASGDRGADESRPMTAEELDRSVQEFDRFWETRTRLQEAPGVAEAPLARRRVL